jgi:hypothetical protein
MGISTPEEKAIGEASVVWTQLPEVKRRHDQVRAILRIEMDNAGVKPGEELTAHWMTRALQINLALNEITPLESVVPWMKRTKQWPFDQEAAS